MNNEIIWGAILIAFILPFSIWYLSHFESIESRKKLYPGDEQAAASEQRAIKIGLGWSAAFIFLIGCWAIGFKPVPALVLTLFLVVVIVGVMAIRRRKLKFMSRRVRIGVAGSVIWLLAVWAWYAVFGQDSGLEESQVVLIVVLPPIFVGIAVSLLSWAMKGDT